MLGTVVKFGLKSFDPKILFVGGLWLLLPSVGEWWHNWCSSTNIGNARSATAGCCRFHLVPAEGCLTVSYWQQVGRLGGPALRLKGNACAQILVSAEPTDLTKELVLLLKGW
ncbi:hypothetical protein MRX96_019711 [Rhipicephalus microplus]